MNLSNIRAPRSKRVKSPIEQLAQRMFEATARSGLVALFVAGDKFFCRAEPPRANEKKLPTNAVLVGVYSVRPSMPDLRADVEAARELALN